MRFGEILSRLRSEHGLSLDDLAERARVPRGSLSLAEQGKRSIKLEYAESLADFFRLDQNAKKEFIDAAKLTRITKAGAGVHGLLEEARAQVKFLAELVGIGVPVSVDPSDVKRYGQEAAEKLAAARRANQQLYERLMLASGKKKPPRIIGADAEDIPDSPLAPPAEPFAQKRRGRGRSA
jgi:transcriptional regulator with XRE-family HTH domain